MKYSTKTAVLVAAIFAGVSGILLAQNKQAASGAGENSAITAPSGTTQSVDETTLKLNDVSAGNTERSSIGASVWLFLRMILMLALVIVAIYAIMRFMKKSAKPAANDDPFLRFVSSVQLSPGKSVQVVTLLDHAYIIGVTDHSVNLIGEVTDKELVDSMNLYADKQQKTQKPRNFNDILSIFMPNGPKENGNVFKDTAQKASDLLKKQRNRLHGDEE